MTTLSKHLRVMTVVLAAFWVMPVVAELANLPERTGPRPITTEGIPHIQIGVQAVPEISAQLLERVAKIAGVEQRGTIVGRSGSTGFWLQEDVALTRPESIIRGREFAHLHPDGSLHASLPPELAQQAIHTGWAIAHPWAAHKEGLEGFVMIYTPMSTAELDVVHQLIIESFKFMTGAR